MAAMPAQRPRVALSFVTFATWVLLALLPAATRGQSQPATRPSTATDAAAAKADTPQIELPATPLGKMAAAGGGAMAAKPMTVRAVLDTTALVPGKPATLGIVLEFAPHYHAHSNKPSKPEFIPTAVEEVKSADPLTFGAAVYPAGVDKNFPAIGGILNVYDGVAVLKVPVTAKADAKPGPVKITGSVFAQICDDNQCLLPEPFPFELTATVAATADAVPLPGSAPAATAGGGAEAAAVLAAPPEGVLRWFGIAFLVGIMFNVVPCVLPVLPLKAVGFYETAGHNRAVSVTFGLAFSAGVVAVFAALGLLVVVFKAFTWGELFSNEWFTGTLVVILVVMAANMFGLFTVNLPTKAYMFSPRHDTYFGNFLFGILTAALSTPCTFGLFVSVLTVALNHPSSAVGLLLVVVVGVGMAFPYVLLSALPEVARKFPRTGPWAELVKQFMAFLLLAVAVFFAQGFIARIADPSWAYWLILIVILAGCAFLIGKSVKYGKTRTAPTVAVVLALLIAVPAFLVVRAFAVKAYEWQSYTPQLLTDLRAKGQPVLVEFTATWCVNCHTLEATVLNSKQIQRAVAENKVVMVKADITDKAAPSFTFWKTGVKAVGVPLTVLYPAGDGAPTLLPGMYSADDLKGAIEAAAKAKTTAMR
jgi:thiol:disulfide interchange protein